MGCGGSKKEVPDSKGLRELVVTSEEMEARRAHEQAFAEKGVGIFDPARVGTSSFKLVLASERSRALVEDHHYDINDQWNVYGASTKLTDLRDAATFCFAADHQHVCLEADRAALWAASEAAVGGKWDF